MSVSQRSESDPAITLVLRRWRVTRPGGPARIDAYRRNSVSIRIRVVDPGFAGVSRAERHEAVWRYIEGLPEDVQSQISLLIPFTPEETKTSLVNIEFEHPIVSPRIESRPTKSRAMLSVTAGTRPLCDGLGRREFLRVGGAGLLGLGLPALLRAEGLPGAAGRAEGQVGGPHVPGRRPRAPGHLGHEARRPRAVRGEFAPIDTTVPGMQFCEHLPMLARQAHHLTLVRSVHHTVADHNAGAYYALTGRPPVSGGKLVTSPSRDDFPPFGAVLAKLRPTGRSLPDFVHTPDWMSNNGSLLPGQGAGSSAAASTRSSPATRACPATGCPASTCPASCRSTGSAAAATCSTR